MSRGRIIVVEGLDGVGKSTASKGLAERLGATHMWTPGPDLADIRATAHAVFGVSQEAIQLFYAASVVVAGRRAGELTEAGVDVVIDRYWLSTMAYATVRGSSLGLEDVEAVVAPADVTFFLTLPEAERRRRLLDRGCTAADTETLRPGFVEAVVRQARLRGSRPVAGRLVEVDIDGLGPEAVLDRLEVELAVIRG